MKQWGNETGRVITRKKCRKSQTEIEDVEALAVLLSGFLQTDTAPDQEGTRGPQGPKGDAGAAGLKGEREEDGTPGGVVKLSDHYAVTLSSTEPTASEQLSAIHSSFCF